MRDGRWIDVEWMLDRWGWLLARDWVKDVLFPHKVPK